MGNGMIGKIIYFWIFMIGVIIFGKVFGFMNDARQSVTVLVGAAIVFVVWTVARYKAKKRREEREYEQRPPVHKGAGKKRG